jgi:hypothetical protein
VSKVLNKATTLPLSHIQTKLNDHLMQMNRDGWELMNAAIEAVGIEELIVCFWRKELAPPMGRPGDES